MIKTSDFKTMPLKVTVTTEDGRTLIGIIKNRDTKNLFDGKGDRAFFEPVSDDPCIASWWVPLSKLNVLDTKIRVLAVRQPWASLIVEGLKTIEVRSRPTNIRGKVAIYASSKIGTLNDTDFVFNSLGAMKTFEEMDESDKIKFSRVYEEYKELTGVIIGTVEIGNTEPSNKDLHWDRRRYHFAPMNKGEYYWNLSNHVKFSEPIPYKPPKGCVVWSKTELPEAVL